MKTTRFGFRPWLVLPAAFLLLALPAAAQEKEKGSRQAADEQRQAAVALEAAREAMEREDCKTAARLLENFLFEHPGSVPALFNLAYCYNRMGRTADALDMYRQTLEVDPELFSARVNLAILLHEAGQTAEAVQQLERALAIDPRSYRAHLYLASVLEEAGERQQAIQHYRRAIELRPEKMRPRRRLLALLLAEEELAAAEDQLAILLGAEPDDPALLRLRADLLLRRGETEAALAAYEDYLEARPGDSSLRLELARHYRDQGRLEDALPHLRAAAEAGEQQALGEYADALAALERWEEAIPVYRRAVERNPREAGLRAGLGFALLKTEELRPAVRELAIALELDPERVDTYNHLAVALTLAGDLAGAIEALDRRARHADETPGTLFLRARNYDQMKQCAPAIEYYGKFLERNQDESSDQYFIASERLRYLKNHCRESRR